MTTPAQPRGRPVTQVIGRPRRVLALGALLLLGACGVGVVPSSEPPPPPALDGPALEEGPGDADEARALEAARLVAEAEEALAVGNADLALEHTRRIEAELADVPGTASVLLLRARAHLDMEAWSEAEEEVERFLARVPPGEPNRPGAMALRARIRVEGDLPGAVEAVFEIPEDAGADVLDEAEQLAARLASDLDVGTLRELVDQAPEHPRVLPVFLTELAVRRALMGDIAAGEALAERALALDPGPGVAERARRVTADRVDELGGESVLLGVLLSEGGPPSLRELSEEIRSGIEVALLEAEENGSPARLQALDDEGSGSRAADLVRQLESSGAVGLIGPLEEGAVVEVAGARESGIPMLSPTARMVPEGLGGVFTLTGVDPSASEALARAATDLGVGEVVVLHPGTAELSREAEFFRTAFEEAGGRVRRTLVYPPDSTSLAEPFGEVVSLRPEGLVLLLAPEDVDLVAPQVAYYGVDDMEITIFGNQAWGSEGVLQSVPTRHTDSVITVTSRGGPGRFGPRWEQFVERYESHFERTLRSPVAALGYDAARLLLYAAAQGDGTPEGTARALESIREFPGATGVLEVVDGRIQRSYQPVRIMGRETVPLDR